jgi:hypothetical protein
MNWPNQCAAAKRRPAIRNWRVQRTADALTNGELGGLVLKPVLK